jgi:hypothetical protein
MTLEEFRAAEAREFDGPLLALWWDGRGDWDRAHEVAQELDDADGAGADGAWVHAYLHRKEGDMGNAAYWYRRAGQPMGSGDLGEEWERMVMALLERRG